jgi:hypothetical protein
MALKFGETKGKAVKKSVESYAYTDGDNTVRLIGGVLPRYIYWLKGTNNKDIPIECLAFDREKEKFTNVEKDWVPEYYPEKKCSWSYSINCIDPKDGKVKALNLKKKLFEQILTAAEDLGDPTDYDEGWDVVFKRQKTGPMAYNVEYTLAVLKCKRRKLTPEERALADSAESIDSKFPRPTADDVKTALEKLAEANSGDSEDQDQEAVKELE